ncbi:MAG TPA: zf-HC2 domain-containing protein [Gemmatimonadales bacterium]|nr:zf-HC2 domain-containing protein [Gemmatimonadales bacterium]
MSAERPIPDHLKNGEVAAYLDRALSPSDRSRIEEHLVDCDACRAEVIEVARLLRTQPSRRGWYVPIGVAAAAAAAVLLLVWPRPVEEPALPPNYREPVVTTTAAPSAIAPRGAIVAASRFVWTAVAHADRYRLTVFDETGSVLWEAQTSDTAAALPESIRLKRGASYFWKIEAQTGWNRWVGSDLVEFSPGPPRP